jgi:hypothetical protein
MSLCAEASRTPPLTPGLIVRHNQRQFRVPPQRTGIQDATTVCPALFPESESECSTSPVSSPIWHLTVTLAQLTPTQVVQFTPVVE